MTESTTTNAPPAGSMVNDVPLSDVHKTIKNYSAAAVAAALIPIPVADLAGLVGVQLKMTHEIAKKHGVTIHDNKGKAAISALLTTIPAGSFTSAAASALKFVPGIGTALGMLAGPAYFSASTYATGRIFHSHFASGGTLLNFDVDAAKDAYRAYFEEAKAKNN